VSATYDLRKLPPLTYDELLKLTKSISERWAHCLPLKREAFPALGDDYLNEHIGPVHHDYRYEIVKNRNPSRDGFPTRFPDMELYNKGFGVDDMPEDFLREHVPAYSHMTFTTHRGDQLGNIGVHGPWEPGTLLTQWPARPERVNLRTGIVLGVRAAPPGDGPWELDAAWNPWTFKPKKPADP
jgi:hypothetical protein